MEKLNMNSPDFTEQNIAKLAELFPNCVTESKDEKGKLRKSIDFDLLKQELSADIVEGPKERYHLNWPGKREALVTANRPIDKALRPCREESVDFDTTQNLFIEGDNLDALKLLQETYLGKVKMIYIDPPYNTGKDFIYKDKFAESTEEYQLESGQRDEEGNCLVANPDSSGRFHSDWLSMMYPRLKLAKNLLKDGGVIFISIDDNEVSNLRRMCDEIFGAENFIAVISNVSNPKGRSDDKYVATAHEYIAVYSKNVQNYKAYGFELGNEILKRYNKVSEQGEKYREIDLRKTGDGDLREDRPNLFYYFHHNPETDDFYPSRERKAPAGYNVILPLRKDGKEGRWRWELACATQRIKKLIPKFMPNRGIWGVMEKDFLKDRDLIRATSAWTFKDVNSERGSDEFISLGFDKRLFPKPKPLGTIKRTCKTCMSGKESEIILDFFAGSATTAHAVMQLNAEDGGNRRFIMVQLPETCDAKSEAFKAGYKNIAEISKERIRRAGEKVKQENALTAPNLDAGFRVLKIDTANMADIRRDPDTIEQGQLSNLTENIKPDRTSEDLLFQVLLNWGVDLTLPITKEAIKGLEVFFVDNNALAACFALDGQITNELGEDLCKELATHEPLRVIFRDSGFENDSVKINVEQIFKLLSPRTDVKTI